MILYRVSGVIILYCFTWAYYIHTRLPMHTNFQAEYWLDFYQKAFLSASDKYIHIMILTKFWKKLSCILSIEYKCLLETLELNTVAYLGCKRTQRKDKTQKQNYLLAKKEQTFIPPFVGMLGCWPVWSNSLYWSQTLSQVKPWRDRSLTFLAAGFILGSSFRVEKCFTFVFIISKELIFGKTQSQGFVRIN